MPKVQISIIHYAEEDYNLHNSILFLLVDSVKEITTYPYRLNVIDNQCPTKATENMHMNLPDVEIIRTKGEHYTFPAGVNTAIENMQGDYLAVLHTDMLVGFNWLTSLVDNLEKIEEIFGVPCATCPLLLPYPRHEPVSVKGIRVRTLKPSQLAEYMDKKPSMQYKWWRGLPLVVSKPGKVIDNGWRMGGAYIASKGLFEEVGLYDPRIAKGNDRCYAMRTLKTRCRCTKSNLVYLHHMGGLSRNIGAYQLMQFDPRYKGCGRYIIERHGIEDYKKMRGGVIWKELHRKQKEKYGDPIR